MQKENLSKIFEFSKFINSFKTLERFEGAPHWEEYPLKDRFESDADHTWRMAMMLILIQDELEQEIDPVKAMKMLLIHDVPEIIAGDYSPMGKSGTGEDGHAYDEEMAEDKFDREKQAAKEIFGMLPEDLADEFYELWIEFEEQKTHEALVVRAIDKLEGKLQAYQMTGGTFKEVHHGFNMKYGVETFKVDPSIEELGDMLLDEMKENFQVYNPEPEKTKFASISATAIILLAVLIIAIYFLM